jgi:hypothetical protein
MLDTLRARAERIREEGAQLLSEFSGMHPTNTPSESVVIISPFGNQSWNDLPPEGKQIQTRLLPEIDRFTDLLRALTRNLPRSSFSELQTALEEIRSAVEQNRRTCWTTRDEAVNGFRRLIDKVITTLEDYYGTSSSRFLAIADTSALLANPDIEQWQFEGADHFTIVLTPTVLSDLDRHKVDHRNEDVRDKASKLIRKIKEYRRRGPLQGGVPIVKGHVSLRSIAREPNMQESLPWFDAANADDRFLATALEEIRANLGARVFIVTSDINMQNKAEAAAIPFCEVPPRRAEQGKG